MEQETLTRGPELHRKEKLFVFFGLISILVCSLLFILQSYLALRSYQILHQLNSLEFPNREQPSPYNNFDFRAQKGKVYLRANTSLFIH